MTHGTFHVDAEGSDKVSSLGYKVGSGVEFLLGGPVSGVGSAEEGSLKESSSFDSSR